MTTTDNDPNDDTRSSEPQPASRRTVLQTLTFGGVAAAGALVGGGAVAARAGSSDSTSSLTLDCALLGDTFRMAGFENEDPADIRGSTFYVEGLLYEGNSVPDGPGFVPTDDNSIGHWFCRGNLLSHPGRPEPHIMSFQEYVFGRITDEQPAPPNMMTSIGLEGMDREFHPMHRALTGGTGDHIGASGQVVQMYVGSNATVMLGDPSPNIRFEFELL